jgi:hypothetical protein
MERGTKKEELEKAKKRQNKALGSGHRRQPLRSSQQGLQKALIPFSLPRLHMCPYSIWNSVPLTSGSKAVRLTGIRRQASLGVSDCS